ncbi:MAG: nickel pincer cofactor biosynthesis protein LarB [Candidatus Hodarchaeales archaeon]
MTDDLSSILNAVASKELSPEDAIERIKRHMSININDLVQFDQYREKRSGIPEVVYAEKKSPELCVEIAKKVISKNKVVLFTRLTQEQIKAFNNEFLESTKFKLELDEQSKLAIISDKFYKTLEGGSNGKVGIITAGTSDIPVAKEAQAVLKLMNVRTLTAFDIGVAGLHRLINPLQDMMKEDIDVLIVIAGMEGALPSVVAGLVDIPVIGVPTSIGYGIRAGSGEVALFSMLNSCSPGLAVVNIDAGFSAGAIAGLIAKRSENKE